jgi:hypothetical protein
MSATYSSCISLKPSPPILCTKCMIACLLFFTCSSTPEKPSKFVTQSGQTFFQQLFILAWDTFHQATLTQSITWHIVTNFQKSIIVVSGFASKTLHALQ